MPKAAKPKYYAVRIGRGGPNIYDTWNECNAKVSRFPGAKHKSFTSRPEAEKWLADSPTVLYSAQPPEAVVGTPRNATPPDDASTKIVSGPPPPSRNISLSPEQSLVLRQVKEGRNVFFTGSAGTGKSVLLREIISALGGVSDALGVTASTGIAAVNIGGTTLHSWAGIGLGQETAKNLAGKFLGQAKFEPVLMRWQNVKSLVIDEISMIDGSLFDKLEYVARRVRHNDNLFGGIQLILSGDFCQLPPVPGRTEKGQEIPAVFAFDAKTWDSCVGSPVTLTKVFRQKDQAFVDMLNAMRFGKLDPQTIHAFKTLSRPVTYADGIEPTELFSTRREVDNSNSTRLRSLKTETRIYHAVEFPGVNSYGQRITIPQMEKILDRLVVPKTVELKVGAQVMLVKNLIPGVLVNGSVGQVIKFTTPMDPAKQTNQPVDPKNGGKEIIPPDAPAWPVVRFINGKELMCIPYEFTVNNADGQMEARRDQIPLILAWALSVHKSQGQTLERVRVDLRRTFERGQAYVALSRATNMTTLQVLNFDVAKVVAHPRVLEWANCEPFQKATTYSDDEDMDNDEAIAAYYNI